MKGAAVSRPPAAGLPLFWCAPARLGRGGQHIHGPSLCRGRQPEPATISLPNWPMLGVFHIFYQHTHLGLCLPAGNA